MKYIDADKLKTNIKNRYDNMLNRAKLDSDNANYWNGKADAYRAAYDIIDSLQKEQTELTQVPRIEQETQKKDFPKRRILPPFILCQYGIIHITHIVRK